MEPHQKKEKENIHGRGEIFFFSENYGVVEDILSNKILRYRMQQRVSGNLDSGQMIPQNKKTVSFLSLGANFF